MLVQIVLFVTSLYLLYSWLKPKRPENFPPGPDSYPLVGSGLFLPKLGNTSHEIFLKLKDLYGPVSGIFLGDIRAIVINGYEASKEFYSLDEFSSRPKVFTSDYRWNGRSLGVFFSNGRLWQEQRRFVLRNLRDFGFGKTSMEGIIHEEVQLCIDYIKDLVVKSEENQVLTINDLFGVSVINLLWRILAGKAYKYDDENFKKLLGLMRDAFRSGNPSGVAFNFMNKYPKLRHFPYFKQRFSKLASAMDAAYDMLEKTIDEHQKTLDESGPPRDLIDVYLKTMNETKDDPSTTFSMDQLIQICMDLFGAGSESTSNSIAFAVLHMVRNPDCQEKVHKELMEIVGNERLPSWGDKPNLPYTFATITEVLRMSPVSPLSVPHENHENVKFMGYDIPKGTWAMVNFTSTNMDSDYWGDPEVFRPERFLDSDGHFIKDKLDHVFGFGSGKRQCLCEPLARMSNYLMFTGIMQTFKFEKIRGEPLSIEAVEGFTVSPKPFSAKVTLRK